MSDGEKLRAWIRADGPVTLYSYMARSNEAYYAARDPLGAAGDFITAPEISQLFGEMIGFWLVSQWQTQGTPPEFILLELGPGRGTLMADCLRAAGKVAPAFIKAARLCLCETSPALRSAQAKLLSGFAPRWIESATFADENLPLFGVANEFFDALPIRQFRAGPDGGWHERTVMADADGALALANGGLSVADPPAFLPPGTDGTIAEYNPSAIEIITSISRHIAARGGACLIIDYGYEGPVPGDTLQALRRHKPVDLLGFPGEADLTAQVDFAPLARAAKAAGCAVHGPMPQSLFLQALGIRTRLMHLCRQNPDATETLARGVARLIDDSSPQAMGRLFKAMAVTPWDMEAPEGFARTQA